jgi:glucokinase
MTKARNKPYSIGFDLGATKMMAVVLDSKMVPVARRRRKTKGNQSRQVGIGRIVDTIREALEEAGISIRTVGSVGIGVPGPVDMERGFVPFMPNLGWRNMPVRARLQKELGCPVAVLNDVDAGVYGEYRFGAGADARCVLGVFPGTGIGGGCVYEGRILRGSHLSCLEIGHIPVVPNGTRCGCGNHGCLETVASRLAVAAATATAAAQGSAPHLSEASGTTLSGIRSSTLKEAIAAGDKVVEEALRESARWLGVGVATAVNILLPDIVVLGGGLVEAFPKLFRTEVGRSARDRVMPAFRREFKIRVAALGDDATAIGAAAWAQHVLSRKGSHGQRQGAT